MTHTHTQTHITAIIPVGFASGNKVVKPHNGPSAVLVLIAIGNHVVEDATGFYGFGINGSLVSNWL